MTEIINCVSREQPATDSVFLVTSVFFFFFLLALSPGLPVSSHVVYNIFYSLYNKTTFSGNERTSINQGYIRASQKKTLNKVVF